MPKRFRIDPVANDIDLCAVAGLFDDYARALPVSLGYQEFDAELAGLPGKYAAPDGALLLARDRGGKPIGCVALRPLDEGVCEMKRLFVAPAARGFGLGLALTQAIVAAARSMGYREIRLDTLASMQRAMAMYEAIGFERVAPYYGPTPAGTVFMALPL